MKVMGIISSFSDPASRARILQYINPMHKEGIFVKPRLFTPDPYAEPEPWAYKLNKYTGINQYRFSLIQKYIKRVPLFWEQKRFDIIWQNRLILFQSSYFEKKLSRQNIFDFDDAIWVYDGKKPVSEAIAASNVVFAGNEYLAEFAKNVNDNVFIIPSTIDTDRLYPQKKQSPYFTIGWIGSKFTFPFLDIIKPVIESFLILNKDARFIVVSSEKPSQFLFDNSRIIFKEWSAREENEHINEFSVGLMPLTDNEFTNGKCSYKMLQYLACGVPVIVSPVGMNLKLLLQKEIGLAATSTDSWVASLTKLKKDADFYKECQENGRTLVEEHYSLKKYVPIISNILKKLI